MALTNSGFDGTVTEAAWAQISALTDVDAVENSAAWAVTQGTGRQVSTAAQSGFAFAKGVLSKDTSPILTNLATPVNGQWFLIVRHIDWAANGVTVTAIAHDVTGTTVPTVAPTSYPVLDATPGVLYDQPLAWAWVRSTDTAVTIFDLRKLTAETRVAALEADTGWIAFPFAAGWSNAAAICRYRRLHGVVYLAGVADGTAAADSFIGTLPPTFRPIGDLYYWSNVGGSGTRTVIYANGNVRFLGKVVGTAAAAASLADFTAFPADN